MRAITVLLGAAIVLAGCADPYADPPKPSARPRQPCGRDSGPLTAPGQDSPNRGERREAARTAQRPAFAHLPYVGEGIAVDYVDERAGRLVLLVLYGGRLAHAHAAYRRFLARYRDSGRAYLAVFQRSATP